MKNNLTKQELEIIKDNYGKISVSDIQKEYLPYLKSSTIYYEASKLKLSSKRIIYNFKWSQDIAYFVGLMAADGNLYHKTSYMIRIELKDNDAYILNKIRDILDIGTVKITERKSYGKIQKSALFRVNNKSLYNKLLEIGLTPNKSLTLKWPKVPKKYYRDFVRGFFDGDGSISFNKASDYKGAWRAVFYSASKDFIYELKNILEKEANIESQNLNKYTACYSYKFGRKDTIKLGKWMYYDSCLRLERKFSKFEKAFKIEEEQKRKDIQRLKDLELLKKYYTKISAKEIHQKYLSHLSIANIYKLGRQVSK